MLIRPANNDDQSATWGVVESSIRAGETFVAEENGQILVTYHIRANRTGGGQHVCHCGYTTDTTVTGRGVARKTHEESKT